MTELDDDDDDGQSLILFHRSSGLTRKAPAATATSPTHHSPLTSLNRSAGKPQTFAELGLDRWILEILSDLSMSVPTAVQAACIPVLLPPSPRCDLVGVAPTGSGKTAAFALPLLHRLHRDPYGPFALILTPTRELAVQITEQLILLGRGISLITSLVIGGLDMVVQAAQIRASRPHFLVATPGRLLDLLQSCPDIIDLSRLRFLVLDEADRLLDRRATFRHELPGIWEAIFTGSSSSSSRPDILCFTATLSDDVLEFDRLRQDRLFVFGRHAEGLDAPVPPSIDQRYLFIPSKVKDVYLYHLLTNELSDRSMIVFVGKCITAQLLTLSLRILKVSGGIVSLHSRNPQRVRFEQLRLFRNGTARILICTDVAARGLDISTVQAVINYDLPADPRLYVHRVGRTGRAGHEGLALSLVSELDLDIVQAIEDRIGRELVAWDPEPEEDVVLRALNRCSDARQLASMRLQRSELDDERARNYHDHR